MWYALLWRVLSWFTWTHIQWLMVQALGPKGLEMALDRMTMKVIHAGWKKPVDKMSVGDLQVYNK